MLLGGKDETPYPLKHGEKHLEQTYRKWKSPLKISLKVQADEACLNLGPHICVTELSCKVPAPEESPASPSFSSHQAQAVCSGIYLWGRAENFESWRKHLKLAVRYSAPWKRWIPGPNNHLSTSNWLIYAASNFFWCFLWIIFLQPNVSQHKM